MFGYVYGCGVGYTCQRVILTTASIELRIDGGLFGKNIFVSMCGFKTQSVLLLLQGTGAIRETQ